MENNYVSGKKAIEILGVHQQTLYQWDKKGKIDTIRTPGGKRLYNVEKYLRERGVSVDEERKNTEIKHIDLDKLDKIKGKLNICYARVSSLGQKDDLERQKKILTEKYPDHILIEDIGSGLNLNKRGIRKIIKLAINGKINELVINYKDRLTRFGYELIEDIIKEYSHGKIIILNTKKDITREEELVRDVLEIMNVYVAKVNGMRKNKKNETNK